MTITLGDQHSGAIFSECQRFRYVLWRNLYPEAEIPATWTDCVWIGLNPSTADHEALDNTCRRCLKWSKEWGCNRYIMLNAFAFRSTFPKVMLAADDPIGPENDYFLESYTATAKIVIAAWGTHCDLIRVEAVRRAVGRPLECLGMNQDGSPRHPLYVPGTAQRTIWDAVSDTGRD